MRGMTLVELVIVIVLTGILFAIGSMVLGEVFRSYFGARDINRVDWQGRVAMERMARELREIRTASPADLAIGTAGEITFMNREGNTVRFYRNGNVLTRSEGGTTNAQPLADYATALSFDYLQSDGATAAATPAQVHFITAILTINDGSTGETLRATVHPRSW
jgi:prepilin-type N-terminal cleavage/methylation domain-containing protein